MNPLYLGIDVGTSGCRAMLIDASEQVIATSVVDLPTPQRDGPRIEQDPELWWDGLAACLRRLAQLAPLTAVRRLALDATSGTVLLGDNAGHALGPALMYNDSRAQTQATTLARHAPRSTAAQGASSGLAKLLWLQEQPQATQARWLMHQADWLVARLTGVCGVSDANNALKTGYDPLTARWPAWLSELVLNPDWLPRVHVPGAALATVRPEVASHLGLSADTQVVAGTTDSTAAFMATGATEPGEAVTSLGSTLVLKVITTEPVFEASAGVYSQPLGNRWLVGGGSNTGGAVLRHYFSDAQMEELTRKLRPDHPTGLDYYPLLAPGERFPVCDPTLAPRLTPRPDEPAEFFQALLEGIAHIEHTGYRRLAELGAPYPTSVRSVGGGARNPAWSRIRQRMLGVPLVAPRHQEAAYGAALLALRGDS